MCSHVDQVIAGLHTHPRRRNCRLLCCGAQVSSACTPGSLERLCSSLGIELSEDATRVLTAHRQAIAYAEGRTMSDANSEHDVALTVLQECPAMQALVTSSKAVLDSGQRLVDCVRTGDVAGMATHLFTLSMSTLRLLYGTESHDVLPTSAWVTSAAALHFRPKMLHTTSVQGLVYCACISLLGICDRETTFESRLGNQEHAQLDFIPFRAQQQQPSEAPHNSSVPETVQEKLWVVFPASRSSVTPRISAGSSAFEFAEGPVDSVSREQGEKWRAWLSTTLSRMATSVEYCKQRMCRVSLGAHPKLLDDSVSMEDMMNVVPTLQEAGRVWPRAFFLTCRFMQECEDTAPVASRVRQLLQLGLILFRILQGVRVRISDFAAAASGSVLSHAEHAIRVAFQALVRCTSGRGDDTAIEGYLRNEFEVKDLFASVARFQLPLSLLRPKLPLRSELSEETAIDFFDHVRRRRYTAASERRALSQVDRQLELDGSDASRSVTTWAGASSFLGPSATQSELTRSELNRLSMAEVAVFHPRDLMASLKGVDVDAIFSQQVASMQEVGRWPDSNSDGHRKRYSGQGVLRPDSARAVSVDFVPGAPVSATDLSIVLDGALSHSIIPANWKSHLRYGCYE
jgi:hypothetical protein